MNDILDKAKKILGKIDIDEKKYSALTIEAESTNEDFWKNQELATSKMKQLAKLQTDISDYELLSDLIKKQDEKGLKDLVKKLENLLYFQGSYDKGPARECTYGILKKNHGRLK